MRCLNGMWLETGDIWPLLEDKEKEIVVQINMLCLFKRMFLSLYVWCL